MWSSSDKNLNNNDAPTSFGDSTTQSSYYTNLPTIDDDDDADNNNHNDTFTKATPTLRASPPSSSSNNLKNEILPEEEDDILRPGDHVFVWEGFSQRHGIVLEAPAIVDTALDADDDYGSGNDNDEDDDPSAGITIVTFYDPALPNRRNNDRGGGGWTRLFSRRSLKPQDDDDDDDEQLLHTSTPNASNIQRHTLSSFQRNSKSVQKVRYSATFARRLLSSGTATTIPPSEPGLILSRLHHLLSHPSHLPPYGKMSANDECAAVWCRTGRWVTLRGASMLEIVGASHAGSAVVAGGVVSHMTVTYMMPWIPGYVLVWSVPATVAYPIIVPLLVGYGLTSLVPLEVLRRYRKRWKETSDQLNRDYWTQASEEERMAYFGGSVDQSNVELAKFFGVSTEEDEMTGKYMPLNMATADDDDDDDDDDNEDTMKNQCDKMAATYDVSGGAESSGRRDGILSEWVQKVKMSFRNPQSGSSPNDGPDPHTKRLMLAHQEESYRTKKEILQNTLL